MAETDVLGKRESNGSAVFNGLVNLLRNSKSLIDNEEPRTRKPNHGSNLSRYEHSRRTFASLVVYYNRHDAWLKPIPWDSKVHFDPEDMHLKLDVLIFDQDKRRFRKGQINKRIRDLFDSPPGSKEPPKNVLVYGDPGYGKTTLCRKIAHYWAAHGKTLPGFSESHTVVVYLKLRTLREDAVLENELTKLVLQEEHFSREDPVFRRVRGTLKAFGRNVIVILDGYDEVSSWHQDQVRSLLSSRSISIFKECSVIVTSRPEIHDELMPLFQKHLILKGLSLKSTQILISRYFRQSPEIGASLYKDTVKSLNLKHLSPLILIVLCYLRDQENQDDAVSPQRLLRLLPTFVLKRTNERQNSGLTEDQLESLLFCLGEYFFERLGGDGRFAQLDIQDSLPEFSGFVIISGLFKSVDCGLGDTDVVVEAVHSVLVDSIIAYYLEEKWITHVLDGGLLSFHDTILHKLDTLQLTFFVHRVNSEDFEASFYYRHFRFSYQICNEVESCSVLSLVKELEDFPDNCLSVSLNVNLTDEDLSEVVTNALKAIFPCSRTHSFLSEVILNVLFKTMTVRFVTDSHAVAYDWFEESDDSLNAVPRRPWTSLTKNCDNLHISLGKNWCTPLTIGPLLRQLLEVNLNFGDNENDGLLNFIRLIRRQFFLVPLMETEAHFPKAHVKARSPDFRIEGRVPFLLRLFSRQDFSLENCDRIDLRFRKMGDLRLSDSLSLTD